MTTIDSKELYEILAETPAEQNIMLAGKHGIGKDINRYEQEKRFYKDFKKVVLSNINH